MDWLNALRAEDAHPGLHDLDGQVLFEAGAAAPVRAVGEPREAGRRQRVQADGTLDHGVLVDLPTVAVRGMGSVDPQWHQT